MTEKENKPPKLSAKHAAFVDELFLNNMNQTQAYLRVYRKPDEKGKYSARDTSICRRLASETMTKPDVRAAVESRLQETTMRANEVLFRLTQMARADHLPFIRFSDNGSVFFDFSHPDARQYFYLIKKIKTKRTRRTEGRGENAEEWEDEWVEVELHDAQSALDKLGRYYKLFDNKPQAVLNIDIDKLNYEQLKRINQGEDPAYVCATPGKSANEVARDGEPGTGTDEL